MMKIFKESKYRTAQWLYWRYRALVRWLAELDGLHAIPRHNFDHIQTGHSRYFTIKQWTDKLRKDEISWKDYANAVSNIVCGEALANAQEQRFQREVPCFKVNDGHKT